MTTTHPSPLSAGPLCNLRFADIEFMDSIDSELRDRQDEWKGTEKSTIVTNCTNDSADTGMNGKS